MVLFSLCSLGHEIAKKTSRVDVEIFLTSGDIILYDAQNFAKMHFFSVFNNSLRTEGHHGVKNPNWPGKYTHHYVPDNVNYVRAYFYDLVKCTSWESKISVRPVQFFYEKNRYHMYYTKNQNIT